MVGRPFELRCKNFNKLPANQSQNHIKWILHCDQRQFIPGILGWFKFQKSIIIYHINRINDKTCMIISIDEKETFDKSQNPFIIKNS